MNNAFVESVGSNPTAASIARILRVGMRSALAVLLLMPLLVLADDIEAGDYIRVDVRGTLSSGIVAIGGETTGVTITASGVTWELDVSGDDALRQAAERLNGKSVRVTGTYQRRVGVEMPHRDIVTVNTLEAAD